MGTPPLPWRVCEGHTHLTGTRGTLASQKAQGLPRDVQPGDSLWLWPLKVTARKASWNSSIVGSPAALCGYVASWR